MKDNTQNDANGTAGGFSENGKRAALNVAVLSAPCLGAIIAALVAEAMTTRAEIMFASKELGADAVDALKFRANSAKAAAASLARLVDHKTKGTAGTDALNSAVEMVGDALAHSLAKGGMVPPDSATDDKAAHGRN